MYIARKIITPSLVFKACQWNTTGQRLYISSTRVLANYTTPIENKKKKEEVEQQEEDVPWYLRPEESSIIIQETKPMPELPADCPNDLQQIVALMHTKLGIEDIKVFDKRDDEDSNEFMKNFILLGTGKSDKHLQKATIEMMNYIKHDLGNSSIPRVEGLMRANAMLKKERKLKRKLQKKNTSYHFEDYGVPMNSWIMVECGNDSITDMNVHLVTEQRRQELNLEALWCKPEEKQMYKDRRRGLINNDNIFSGLRRYHTEAARTAPNTTSARDLNNFLNEMTIQDAKTHISKQEFKEQLNTLPQQQDTITNFTSKLQLYTTLNQISPTEFPVDIVDDIFLQKICDMNDEITISDLQQYLISVIDAPGADASDRISRMLSILEMNESQLLKDGSHSWQVELIPYLLCNYSQFTRSDFVKPRDILDHLEDPQAGNLITATNSVGIPYSYKEVDALYELLVQSKFNFLHDEQSQLVLLLFLTIYGNAKNYGRFYHLLDDIVEVDIQNDRRPWDFVISYIYKTGNEKQYAVFLDQTYPRILAQKDFKPSAIFQKYLKLMME